MSCYVDALMCVQARERQAYRVGARNGHQWCHLWADDTAQLHALAEKIGLRREWFQDKKDFPHYDLTPSRRVAAIKAGAREVSLRQWLRAPVLLCPDCKRPVSEVGTQIVLGNFRECGRCFVGSLESEWKTIADKTKGQP